MRQSNFIFKSTLTLFTALFCYTAAFAQTNAKTQAEPSYEIVLQIIAASKNVSEKPTIPPTLSSVVKTLKDIYPNTNYSLSTTYFQRVVNSSNLDVKGISLAASQNQDASAPIFSEWSVGDISTASDARGAIIIQLTNFRFGQKIPVKTSVINGEPQINYESVGIAMRKINLLENTPTIIGNLSSTLTDEQMFLIMTIKPAQN